MCVLPEYRIREVVEKALRHQGIEENAEEDRCRGERKPVSEKNALKGMRIRTGETPVPLFKR